MPDVAPGECRAGHGDDGREDAMGDADPHRWTIAEQSHSWRGCRVASHLTREQQLDLTPMRCGEMRMAARL